MTRFQRLRGVGAARRIGVLVSAVVALLLVATAFAAIGTRTTGLTVAVGAPTGDTATARGSGDGYRVVKEQFGRDPVCERKRNIKKEAGPCRRVFILRVTPRHRYVAPRSGAERGGNLWCRDWKAALHGLYYVNWKEEVQGSYCYNTAALTIYRLDYRCGYGYGIGYSVEQKDCYDKRRSCDDCTAGWMMSVYDQFKVSAIARGIPLFKTYQFHVNLHPTGTIAAYQG